MAKTIVIAVTNDLVTDQRVARVASTLFDAGHSIVLIGRELPNSLALNRNYSTKRFKLWFNKGPFFYANYNLRLFIYLVFNKFDILLANDLDTLLGGFLATKLRRKKIVYDSHEYFTEVPELINRKLQQKAWLPIEKFIVPKLKYTYTVSESIAYDYNLRYGTSFKTIRNLPFKKPAQNCDKQEVLIYQGALNIGRGIELMIESMAFAENLSLWIAGTGDLDDELKALVKSKNLQNKVYFLGRVSPDELHIITSKAKLGLSFEEDRGKNYRFALPNKLFDYIQAKIPVLVSDLPEMRTVVNTFEIGEILQSRNPEKVAIQIARIIYDTARQKIWENNLNKAAHELCWENEKQKLITIFNQVTA